MMRSEVASPLLGLAAVITDLSLPIKSERSLLF